MRSFTNQRKFYEALALGDEQAFAQLYRLLHHRVLTYITSSGGTHNDARTVVHETIISLLFNIRYQRYEWREEAELMTYVVQIARNKWLAMRRESHRFVPVDLLAEATHPEEETRQQADEANFDRRRQTVMEQLSQLGEKCRRCIELYYWEKKTMLEIAQLLGWLTADVAKKEKYRCLQRLRRRVGLIPWAD